jgi:ABC-type antimicrobial peptide transport system permease subunit
MKTAMQELLTYILVDCRNESGTIQFNAHETFNKFLEKEKQQILTSYDAPLWITGKPNITAEQYYNQTYNQDNSFMNNGTWNTFSI